MALDKVNLATVEKMWRREVEAAWHRARRRGRYNVLAARGTDQFAPTLFQGLAGVGYTFLRLATPTETPSVLLLE